MSEPFGGPRLAFSRSSRFTAKAYEDLKASSKPGRIKGVWPMQGVVFVVGASGTRKTFFVMDGTLKLAGGANTVWGRRAKQCGVIYIAAEDPVGCEARVDAWKRTKGKHRTSPVPFELVPQAPDLLNEEDFSDLKAHLAEAAERLQEKGCPLGIVVLDTWSACLPGADENSSAEMSRALRLVAALAEEMGVLVVVVAHFGKSGAERGIRGWSGLGANADGVIGLELQDDDKDLTVATFNKVKNGRAGGRLSFTLEEVDLGFDDDGDPMTSCVVRYHEPPAAEKRPRKQPVESKPGPKIILRALSQLLEVGSTYVVPPHPGVPPGTSGVMRIDLRKRAGEIGHPSAGLKEDTAKRMINKDISELIADGKLREEDGLIWRIK